MRPAPSPWSTCWPGTCRRTSPSLDEGLFKSPDHEGLDENLGRNSFLQTAYLPPDPPTGHGPHLYAFQIFALDRKLDFGHPPARSARRLSKR